MVPLGTVLWKVLLGTKNGSMASLPKHPFGTFIFKSVYYRKRSVVVCNYKHTHVFVYNLGIYRVLCPFPGILTVLHSILCNLHSGQRVGRDEGPSLHGLHWACAQPKTSPDVPQHLCFYPTLSSGIAYLKVWRGTICSGVDRSLLDEIFTLTCSLWMPWRGFAMFWLLIKAWVVLLVVVKQQWN